MRTGTSVFLVAALLISVLVGAGYMASELSTRTAEVRELQGQVSDLQQELTAERLVSDALGVEVAKARGQVSDLQQELAAERLASDALEAEAAELRAQLAALEDELRDERVARGEAQAEAQRLGRQLEELLASQAQRCQDAAEAVSATETDSSDRAPRSTAGDADGPEAAGRLPTLAATLGIPPLIFVAVFALLACGGYVVRKEFRGRPGRSSKRQ